MWYAACFNYISNPSNSECRVNLLSFITHFTCLGYASVRPSMCWTWSSRVKHVLKSDISRSWIYFKHQTGEVKMISIAVRVGLCLFFSVEVAARRPPALQRTTTWPDGAPCRLLWVPSSQRLASRVRRRLLWRRSRKWCRAVRMSLNVQHMQL